MFSRYQIKYGLTNEDCEDLFQEYQLQKWLRGYERNNEHLIIDYLDKRKDHSRDRATGNRVLHTKIAGYAEAFSGGRTIDDVVDDRANKQRQFECSSEISKLLMFEDKTDAAMLRLKEIWGLSEAEVGNIFSVSESRVSQRIKRIQERLQSRAAKKAALERKAKESLAGTLPENAGTDRWRMEQESNQGMAEGQSFEVETIATESF
jgi:DNA-directed RNA polymerase specialized sigma24 family protein